MKQAIKLLFLIIILITAITACKKEQKIFYSISGCTPSIASHLGTTHHSLIGKWDWVFYSCLSPSGYIGDDEKNIGVSIEFKEDSTVIVKENGQTTNTSTWKVHKPNTEFITFETDPTLNLLRGCILFCDNYLELNSSKADGCDNFFKRK